MELTGPKLTEVEKRVMKNTAAEKKTEKERKTDEARKRIKL